MYKCRNTRKSAERNSAYHDIVMPINHGISCKPNRGVKKGFQEIIAMLNDRVTIKLGRMRCHRCGMTKAAGRGGSIRFYRTIFWGAAKVIYYIMHRYYYYMLESTRKGSNACTAPVTPHSFASGTVIAPILARRISRTTLPSLT